MAKSSPVPGHEHGNHAAHGTTETAPLDPAATLRPDAFDAPAAVAVAEAAKAAGGGHADHSAAHYTCPMHPEVISATPGQCPKCGMTLVPAAPKKEK